MGYARESLGHQYDKRYEYVVENDPCYRETFVNGQSLFNVLPRSELLANDSDECFILLPSGGIHFVR